MTNEELIEALTTLKEQAQYYGDNTFVWSINIDSFNFVIDHTIKALKQEPTPKNDLGVDAVSRQAVLELIADYDLSMGQVVRGIHALSSITPQEPKTGHWIDEGFYADGHSEHAFMCSKCEGHYIGYAGDFKWCPYCGSDNREVEE